MNIQKHYSRNLVKITGSFSQKKSTEPLSYGAGNGKEKRNVQIVRKKLYYISAEFLIGKLLSNNMINHLVSLMVKMYLHKR